MKIYPEKGFNPPADDYYHLACAALKFGLSARVGREKTKSGYRRYVEISGIEKTAPGGSNTGDGHMENNPIVRIPQEVE